MDFESFGQAAASGASAKRDILSMFNQGEDFVIALLESATQAIIAADRSGKIVLANQRTQDMFGYAREELLGASIELLLPESKREGHIRQRHEYFAHPRIRPMGLGLELAGRRKDGKEFPVEVSLSYIESQDGRYAIAFVSDVSQRKQLEEQLMHAHKMEAVGRLAGGVAHDFNNMLTVVAGYGRMILDELPPAGPLRSYAEEILKAAERAGALTHQLLAFSRRQIMQPRVVAVNTVVKQTENMLHRLISEDVDLVLALKEEAGNIRADPGQVEQALVNLAVNARDAMPRGGRITIETCNVHLDEGYARAHPGVQPGEYVMIAVSDTGHGMDAETRQHIFEPFFTTKAHGKGTGLGLATVYGIVKQTGGDIWVYSEPGQGTAFKLYFPRVLDSASEAPGVEGEVPQEGHGETILMVEDELAVRELTAKILRRLGYEVLTAANGVEALEISGRHKGSIALLLTDVVMPNMSGRQLADELIEVRPDIKVLYLSGYTENTVLHHGVLDSGVDFLAKPYSREVLARKLRELLAGK